jgi:hypothetical protein
MPDLHVVDSTWLGLPPRVLAEPVARPAAWRRWWPQFRLSPTELRGEKGVRWAVLGAPHRGRGSAELWLAPELEGTVAHWILRLDYPPEQRPSAAALARQALEYRAATKRALWRLGDELDRDRFARLTGVTPR